MSSQSIILSLVAQVDELVLIVVIVRLFFVIIVIVLIHACSLGFSHSLLLLTSFGSLYRLFLDLLEHRDLSLLLFREIRVNLQDLVVYG